jgi:hypothetical protein
MQVLERDGEGRFDLLPSRDLYLPRQRLEQRLSGAFVAMLDDVGDVLT